MFDLPVEKMREGYYTDAYFNHTRSALLADGRHPRVLMQVFQRRTAMLGGMDEAIAVLKLCSHDWDALDVSALHDGDTIEPWETVMTIEGDYTLFAHLETVYLGVLARRTLISTNTERVLRAANGKPIIFMPARHDHHRVQTGDGYAAYVAGAMSGTRDRRHLRRAGVVVGRPRRRHRPALARSPPTTATPCSRRRSSPSGRRPTSASPSSSTSRTTRSPPPWRSPTRSGRSSGASGSTPRASSSTGRSGRRWATSTRAGSTSASSARCARRSTPPGTRGVRIVASGGFSVEKIEEFERRGVPVDAYGVGSSLIRGENDFTADIVVADGKPSSKVGRRLRPNPRLERVRLSPSSGTSTRRSTSCSRTGSSPCPAPTRRFPRWRGSSPGPRANGVVHVASADDHELTDPEISATPDFVSTYPPHCLRGTRGAQRIPETEQADPLPLSHVAYPPGLVRELIAGRREILLLKKSFDVFTNPNAEAVLDASIPPR